MLNKKIDLTPFFFLIAAGSYCCVAECTENDKDTAAVKEMNIRLNDFFCNDMSADFKEVCSSSNNKNKVACNFFANSDYASIEEEKKLCSENISTACNMLGELYLGHSGEEEIKIDTQAARESFEKACNLDDGAGCYWVGRLFMDGTLGKTDYEKSFTFLKKSCDLDDPEGCRLLGTLYQTGAGVKQDLDSAVKYYEKSCRWLASGCSSLSYLYYKGIGVDPDLDQAIQYYILSENGYGYQFHYEENPSVFGENLPLENIGKQLRSDCEKNNAKSCFLLGRISDVPAGSPVGVSEEELNAEITDDEMSDEKIEYKYVTAYYEKACDLNLAEGCDYAGSKYGLYMIHDCQDSDRYGVHDYEKSEKYLKKGCELNNAHACAHLAALYKIFPNGNAEQKDKADGNVEKTRELTKTADSLNQKACKLDPGMVSGNFQMTMDNVLMNSHDLEHSFRGNCSKYTLTRDPDVLMHACDLQDASACIELLNYHLTLQEPQHDFKLIYNLIYKIEKLRPSSL